MAVFAWDNSFETGFSEVDKQHHYLVDVTNQFGELLSRDEVDAAAVDALLEELVSYTHYHFEEEEKLMRSAGIDERHLQHHVLEHQGFFRDVDLLSRELSTRSKVTEKSLFDFLINWLVYHILGSDMTMARQLAMIASGATPEEAYLAKEKGVDNATASLLKALNNLFSQVTQRNRQLAEFNANLESKVERRTRDLCEANRQLEKLAKSDVLTGLANRRYAMEILETLWTIELQNHDPLGCMLIDADHFKEVNDSYGHDAGDIVLRDLARELEHSVRTDDVVCRLGGDEFLIICPRTGADGLRQVSGHVHRRVAAMKVEVPGGFWRGSISVGTAVRSPQMERPEDLLKAADEGVYAAKQAGKNCVKAGGL